MGCIQASDLLDTPRLDFQAAQLHLRDSTLPRPLLHRSRVPPTIRSEYVALQPHLAPSPPTRSSVSVHPSVTLSTTRPSATPPVSLAQRQSDCPSLSDCLYTILPRLSGCPMSHHLHDTPTSPSDHPPPSHRLYDTPISPSACPSPADCLTATRTRLPVRTSFPTIHHTHDSIQSLAVMNGE